MYDASEISNLSSPMTSYISNKRVAQSQGLKMGHIQSIVFRTQIKQSLHVKTTLTLLLVVWIRKVIVCMERALKNITWKMFDSTMWKYLKQVHEIVVVMKYIKYSQQQEKKLF